MTAARESTHEAGVESPVDGPRRLTGGWRVLRYALGAAGLAGVGFGGSLLLSDPLVRNWQGVARWLIAAVVLHDGVLVPVVLALGALLGARRRRRLRWTFVVAGSVTVVALPVLLRPGATANPSVLPLDYPRGWAISVGAVVAAAVVWSAGRWALRKVGRSTGRGSGRRAHDDHRTSSH
ncbi:MAG TPA: hypothetical protein VGL02_08990 [Streptomyces sp.]